MWVTLAGPLILWLNRSQWFFLDDWNFVLQRDGGDLASVFAPHWGHNTALPILVYRALFNLVGVRSYVPYQLPVVALHLIVATQMRILMRRSGVDAWLATAGGVVFLFLGSGRSNLAWGFQLTMTGSIVGGLGALVVLTNGLRTALPPAQTPRPGDATTSNDVPHDGSAVRHVGPAPSGRRIGAAALLLVVSVLCSNVAIPMLVLVGFVAYMLHGRQIAILAVLPAVVVYSVWMLLAPVSENVAATAGPLEAAKFAVRTASGSLVGLTTWWPLAVLVVGCAITGALRLLRTLGEGDRRRLVVPLGFTIMVPVLALMIGRARGIHDENAPTASRYVYLNVVMLLIPLMVALSELVRDRDRRWHLAMCMIVLAWLPGNLYRVGPNTDAERRRLGDRDGLIYLADVAPTLDLPAGDEILVDVTVGDLAMLRRDAGLPAPSPGLDDREMRSRATVVLLLRAQATDVENCRPVPAGEPLPLQAGQVLAFAGPQRLTHLLGGEPGVTLRWQAETRAQRTARVHGDITVSFEPIEAGGVELCDPVVPFL